MDRAAVGTVYPMDDKWTNERMGRPAIWIAGRALVLTLIVLLAISFDRGTVLVGVSQSIVRLSWPAPLGYLTVLFCIYLTSCLYFALGWRLGTQQAIWVLHSGACRGSSADFLKR